MFCDVPHNSLLVQPNGNLSLCCSGNHEVNIGHISEVDDLFSQWQDHSFAKLLREDDPSAINKMCSHCYKQDHQTRWDTVRDFHGYLKKDGKIRYLEYTPSNICNQACVGCNSYYSSMWQPLEDELQDLDFPLDQRASDQYGFGAYGHSLYKMTTADIDKIIKILPDLQTVCIKGGEPFADINNYRILKELFEVNPDVRVFITSNISHVPKQYLELLKDRDVRLSVSIDGTDDLYNYIRSSSFDKTIDNLKQLRHYIKTISVGTYLSIYNMWSIDKFIDEMLQYDIDAITIQDWIERPNYIAPQYLLTEDQIKDYYSSVKLPQSDILIVRNFYKLKSMYKQKHHDNFKIYNRWMNSKRQILSEEIVPQLVDIINN